MSRTAECGGYKKFGRKLGYVITFLLLMDFSSGEEFQDACTEFVEYKTDNNNETYALIKVPRKIEIRNLELLLNIQITKEQKIFPNAEVVQDGVLDYILRYNVSLPSLRNCQNRILGISVDNKELCGGPDFHWDPPCAGLIYQLVVLTKQLFALPAFPESNSVDSKSNPYVDECGTFLEINHLIYHGKTVTQRTDFPWLVAMFIKSVLGLKFICGGTLISKKHVVTAAHCVNHDGRILAPKELVLLLGRKNLQSWANDGAVFVEPERIIIHPDFNKTSADADIAVLVFPQEIVFTTNVKPACLWSGNNSLQNIVNRIGVVVGWGRDEDGRVLSLLPKEVTLPVVDQQTCLWSHKAFIDMTSDRTFCAGNRNNSGPCNGDSGGGFVMKVDDKWVLRGITSLSISKADRTCDLSNYVIFTDTSKFTDWLLNNIT